MRLVLWGTGDVTKPRVRILRDGLRINGVQLTECRSDIWSGISDKSQIGSLGRWIFIITRILFSYPRLIFRYLRLPKHDWILLCYPATIDVFVIYPFAKLRGAKIAMDWFISAYDTVVLDRQLISPRHPLAWFIRMIEWSAIRLADQLFMDTSAHAVRMERLFHLKPGTCGAVWVGVEDELFKNIHVNNLRERNGNPLHVLFYGQFIPLHGVATIIEAAAMLEQCSVEWTIIGRGQEAKDIRKKLQEHPLQKLRWVDWVEYEELTGYIWSCDICLGIFGSSEKAASVIPNKVYQALSAGRPIITRDSPAIRELLHPDSWKDVLVPPGDPAALVAAIQHYSQAERRISSKDLASPEWFCKQAIGQQLISLLNGRPNISRP